MIEESVEMDAKLWVPEYDTPELWHKEISRLQFGIFQGTGELLPKNLLTEDWKTDNP